MQSEKEKAFYERYSKKFYSQSFHDSEGIESLKRSTDSLYKKLDTPYDETQDNINESNNHSITADKDCPLANKTIKENDIQQKLISNLNQCRKFSKKQTHSQFDQLPKQKVVKPSTPTFHAQSSLNFLKNRKQQIIMNQAMGLTYDNLQHLKKSLSKKHEQKSLQKYKICENDSNLKNNNLNNYHRKRNSIKNHSASRPTSTFSRARSFSQLSKIEQILDSNDQKSSKRSFLERSRINTPRSYSKAKSLTYELGSSRSSSISSQNSKSSTSKSTRAALINSIAEKINESKLLRDIQILKEKKNKKKMEKTENIMEKKLRNLQTIFLELQNKPKVNKNKKQSETISRKNEVSVGLEFIFKLKQELDNLNNELSKISKPSVHVKIPEIIKNSSNYPDVQNCNKTLFMHPDIPKSEHHINHHMNQQKFLISKPGNYQFIENLHQSQPKITFNYNRCQKQSNQTAYHPFVGQSQQFSNQDAFSNYRNAEEIFKTHQQKTSIPGISNFSYTSNAMMASSIPIQNRFQSLNSMPSQLQMVPQLSYHPNKTISLKNKNAIEAKRQSPIKVSNFNFMSKTKSSLNFY